MKALTAMLLSVLLAGAFAGASAQDGGKLTDRIMLDGMYRRNLGEFGETWGSAAGGFVSYGIAFPDRNLLVIRTGYVTSRLADGVSYPDAKLDIVPILVGGRYYFPFERLMPFFEFTNGLDIISENTALDGAREERTHVKYAWALGVGATLNLTARLGVDLTAGYQSHFYTQEAMATGFIYTAGLAWNLGE